MVAARVVDEQRVPGLRLFVLVHEKPESKQKREQDRGEARLDLKMASKVLIALP